jgi:hypothetical protein
VGFWELVCHHTYAGTPGVVVDLSPGRGSHAVAEGLQDADILADGVTPGSGAVNLFDPGARIHEPAGPAWAPLDAVRG